VSILPSLDGQNPNDLGIPSHIGIFPEKSMLAIVDSSARNFVFLHQFTIDNNSLIGAPRIFSRRFALSPISVEILDEFSMIILLTNKTDQSFQIAQFSS
jgi:hypothetical protein